MIYTNLLQCLAEGHSHLWNPRFPLPNEADQLKSPFFGLAFCSIIALTVTVYLRFLRQSVLNLPRENAEAVLRQEVRPSKIAQKALLFMAAYHAFRLIQLYFQVCYTLGVRSGCNLEIRQFSQVSGSASNTTS
jgi:hypothetical protein